MDTTFRTTGTSMFSRIILFISCLCTASCLRLPLEDRLATTSSSPETTSRMDNSSESLLPFSPNNLAMLRKMPAGMGSFSNLLPLFIGSGKSSTLSGMLKAIAPAMPSLLRDSLHLNTSSEGPQGQQCLEDLNTYTSSLTRFKPWAIKMADASGRPEPGLMKGSLTWFGNFDECLEVVSDPVNETGRILHGDTCLVTLPIPSALMASIGQNVDPVFGVTPDIVWHICVPNSCSGQTLKEVLGNSLSSYNFSVKSVVCHRDIKPKPLRSDPAAIGVIVLTSILGSLVILGSALDLFIRATKSSNCDVLDVQPPKEESTDVVHKSQVNGNVNQGFQISSDEAPVEDAKLASDAARETSTKGRGSPKGHLWSRLLLCFSAVTSGEKILSVKSTTGSLTCLNGIRVLSMGWIILGHTFLVGAQQISNVRDLLTLKQTLGFQIILNGTVSVDSFFLLSGLLVTYLFLRETNKLGGLKCKQMIMYYVHRYIRLTPAYAFVMFMHTCLLQHLVDGPKGTGYPSRCETNWWINLLYLNNIVRSGYAEECMSWSWFLGNDMQFYVIAPLALIPWALSDGKGRFRLLMKCLGCIVTTAMLIISITSTAAIMSRAKRDYFSDVYIVPWCRVGPFAIGMALAFFLHKTKCKINISPFLQGVFWLLALVISGACTMSTYDENGPGKSPWGMSARTAYETLLRSSWALALAYLILMCCCNKGGIINWILSWNWWQPLSRLTYGAYIVHPIFLFLEMQTSRGFSFFTIHFMVNSFFGYFCRSYLASFVLAILVEAPVLQLEKLLLR